MEVIMAYIGIGILLGRMLYSVTSLITTKRKHDIEDLEWSIQWIAIGFGFILVGLFT